MKELTWMKQMLKIAGVAVVVAALAAAAVVLAESPGTSAQSQPLSRTAQSGWDGWARTQPAADETVPGSRWGYGPGMMGRGGAGFGPGMMGRGGAGFGPGMMGRGGAGFGPGMMGGGWGGFGPEACWNGGLTGKTVDPAEMAQQAETALASQKAALAALEAQLGSATDEKVKAALAYRVELAKVQTGWMEARLPVIKSLPTDALQARIALARADVDYFSKATSTDASLKDWIAARLGAAQNNLKWLEEQAKQ